MNALASLALLGSLLLAGQSEEPRPIKFQIRHADPWMIAALLQGQPVSQPEISTLFGFLAPPPPPVNNVGSLLPPGRIIINPADNTIWFIPDKR